MIPGNTNKPAEATNDKKRGNGETLTIISNARNAAANPMSFTPGHRRPDGRLVSAMLSTYFVVSDVSDPKGEAIPHPVTMWGGQAVNAAKWLSPGRQIISAKLRFAPWRGRVMDGEGFAQSTKGGYLEVPHAGFQLLSCIWGSESRRQVSEEIKAGMRPEGWDVQGSQGFQTWIQQVQEIKKMTFVAGMEWFGYARVIAPPEGSTIMTEEEILNARRGGGGMQTYAKQTAPNKAIMPNFRGAGAQKAVENATSGTVNSGNVPF